MSETESARASHHGEREREPTKEPERIYEASIRKVDFFFPTQCMLQRSPWSGVEVVRIYNSRIQERLGYD